MSAYVERLNAAWVDHLAPRSDDAPTVISTFAGCGGSSLGYSMAGYRELLAVEWEQNAVDTFRLNFPDVPVYHGDIAKLSVDECLRLTGLQPGELDVFDGSPPCQGFSTAGKRQIDDPRNQLFREYVRLLKGLRPKVFVMENVSGMVKGKMKLVFAEILRELKACGYRVSARLLNAMYFHVPQSRQRMIFIGVREDLGIEPSHPGAQGRPIVFREATVGVADEGKPLGEFLQLMGEHQPANLWSSHPATWVHLKGNSASSLNTKWASWEETPGTIAKSWISISGMVHPDRQRYWNEHELARIGSFPDGYEWIGDLKTVISRIGNSVPPLFMRAIAEHVRANILQPALQSQGRKT